MIEDALKRFIPKITDVVWYGLRRKSYRPKYKHAGECFSALNDCFKENDPEYDCSQNLSHYICVLELFCAK
jgi:hypothetical protein